MGSVDGASLGGRRPIGPWLGVLVSGALAGPLGGCTAPTSPAVPLFGAYFPSWLLCAAAGVVGAVVGRVVLIRLGVDEGMPLRLLVYTCLAAAIGFTLAAAVFGR